MLGRRGGRQDIHTRSTRNRDKVNHFCKFIAHHTGVLLYPLKKLEQMKS
uniref:Uncharacterized protein n=1 Tax=Rhizophora mucronata TaxID=61149 RepID=A0A2P2QQ16_RHIMU